MGSSRVSLACVPCRNRHVRCDAEKPHCQRCALENRQCHYAKSRRGGLTRAILAARQQRTTLESPRVLDSSVAFDLQAGLEHRDPDSGALSSLIPEQEDENPLISNDISKHARATVKDPLIELYYQHFHRFHPFVLPGRNLETLLRDEPTTQDRLKPLLSVIRLIGSLFTASTRSETQKLRAEVDSMLKESQPRKDGMQDPFMVQSQLLFSIFLFWSCDKPRARRYIDAAMTIAFDLGMHLREFAATERVNGNAVQAESWRRTWWQICLVDVWYAAIQRTFSFPTCEVDATVDLPCEEDEYESGNIPVPKTLAEFESREFSIQDHTYSSFAYLIGVMRGVALSHTACRHNPSRGCSQQTVEATDAAFDGWLLLLPESKREVLSENGEIDELIFQAHMVMHTSLVWLHRPLSKIRFNPLENISSCSPAPADNPLTQESLILHTTRCLRSIEAQIRLMSLPVHSFAHTPFTICMITTGIIPLLSACKFLFTGQRLAVAREQIRLTIGCLRALADIWPQGKQSLSEFQTIARDVLGLMNKSGEQHEEIDTNMLMGIDIGQVSLTSIGLSDMCGLHGAEDSHESPGSSLDDFQNFWSPTELDLSFSTWQPEEQAVFH